MTVFSLVHICLRYAWAIIVYSCWCIHSFVTYLVELLTTIGRRHTVSICESGRVKLEVFSFIRLCRDCRSVKYRSWTTEVVLTLTITEPPIRIYTPYTIAIFAAISNAIFFFWYMWTSKTDLNSLQPTYKVFLFPQKVSEGYDCWATREHRERELDMFEPYLYTHSVQNMLFTF
jgi:hypothetical protein